MAQAEHLEESSALASRIQEELAVVTGSEGRGVKQAPFRVLVGAAMPAVLVEVAFISNPEEEKLLASDALPAEDRGVARAGHRALPAGARGAARRRGGRAPPGAPMTPRQANVLTALGLLGLLATVALTAPRWAALLRAPSASLEAEEPAAEDAGGAGRRRARTRAPVAGSTCGSTSRPPTATACCPRSARWPSRRTSRGSCGRWSRSSAKGSTTGLLATLPAETRVLDVFVQARGVAYVNLSAEAASGLPGGSRAELLTVYSIVNTIVTNFPAVSRVQIVVDDQIVPSLGGHVDLSRPLPPDMTLVALPAAPRRLAGEPVAVGGRSVPEALGGDARAVALVARPVRAGRGDAAGDGGGGAPGDRGAAAGLPGPGGGAADARAAPSRSTAEFVPTDFVTAGRKGEVVEDEFQAAREAYGRHRALALRGGRDGPRAPGPGAAGEPLPAPGLPARPDARPGPGPRALAERARPRARGARHRAAGDRRARRR